MQKKKSFLPFTISLIDPGLFKIKNQNLWRKCEKDYKSKDDIFVFKWSQVANKRDG